MLERVVRTLLGIPGLGPVVVSIDAPELAEAVPGISKLLADGALRLTKSEGSPSQSVLRGLEELPKDRPTLLTTADHALLDRSMVEHFLAAADDLGPDLAIGMVSSEIIQKRFPDVQRTYLRFRDGAWSGANLFALRTPAARRAIEFWRRAESHRKRPLRMIREFGLWTLVLFASGRLTRDAGLARASRTIGARVAVVDLPFAEAAVDVDKVSDWELVNSILADEDRARA